MLIALGIRSAAAHDLTTAACKEFNARAAEFEDGLAGMGIRGYSYAAAQELLGVFGPLMPAWRLIAAQGTDKLDKANDGLVAVSAAVWRKEFFRGIVPNCDHLNLIGWWEPNQLTCGETAAALEHRIRTLYTDIADAVTNGRQPPLLGQAESACE
jgi:hypothetical protein